MSKEEELEKRTETLEGKRPWEAGFAAEESQQKAEARARKGDDPDAIKDTLIMEQVKSKKSS